MDEKTMVNDILASVKSDLTAYQTAITETENMRNFNRRQKYSDFDELQDIETLAMQKNRCMVRTWKLMPTLRFMQDAWRKIWSIESDDEYTSWIRLEKNILTYYKPRND